MDLPGNVGIWKLRPQNAPPWGAAPHGGVGGGGTPMIIGVPPARSYTAGRAGLVGGAGYPACSWGVGFGVREIWRDVPQYEMMM
jgi:hypothetical protein